MNNYVSLFVYGTLKSGHRAHEHFFRRGVEVEEAVVRGELYDRPEGYPSLRVPPEDALATGTADPELDAKVQSGAVPPERPGPAPGEIVHGEVVRCEVSAIPDLDVYEGFDPSRPSLYSRRLIPAWTASGERLAAWAYVVESSLGKRIEDGRWRP